MKKVLISILIITVSASIIIYWYKQTKRAERTPLAQTYQQKEKSPVIQETQEQQQEPALSPAPKAEITEEKKEEPPKTRKFDCTGERAFKFDCYRAYYSDKVKNDSIASAFEDLKKRYEKDPFTQSQCHQIVHVIGYEASKKKKTVAEAYKEGDSFCWSGYYHGVLEEMLSRIGYGNLVNKIDDICKPLRDASPFSFNHYNCVHGLGHGIMAISDDELFKSLETCDKLTDSWERASCWSGAFMENVMNDSKYHSSKYLKPEDPLYPCNAVEEQQRNTCYLMQTSYMLTLVNNNFEKVFELCAGVEENYRDTCYQSLGRDASGQSISDVQKTKELCYLGKDYAQKENCIIGAVKDFVSYFHDDKKAKELCLTLDGTESSALQNACLRTVESYYKAF